MILWPGPEEERLPREPPLHAGRQRAKHSRARHLSVGGGEVEGCRRRGEGVIEIRGRSGRIHRHNASGISRVDEGTVPNLRCPIVPVARGSRGGIHPIYMAGHPGEILRVGCVRDQIALSVVKAAGDGCRNHPYCAVVIVRLGPEKWRG